LSRLSSMSLKAWIEGNVESMESPTSDRSGDCLASFFLGGIVECTSIDSVVYNNKLPM
jgi:hypothetical protein